MTGTKDIWSEWLKHRRFGDAAHQVYAMEQYKKIASKIVENAEIFETAIILDIGAGDGLVGLTALPKLGVNGKLILSDISEAALSIPKDIFNNKEIKDERVEFLVARVENLISIQNNSIDRVLIRSVLLYVKNKLAAFSEIFRVLRPGGKAVILEPINQRMIDFEKSLFRGYRLDQEPLLSVQSLLKKVIKESKTKNQGSLLGYNEHDLVHLAVKAGFEEIKMEYTLKRSSQVRYSSWKFFFDAAPNPKARTLREIMTDVLTKDEFKKVEIALKKVIQKPAVHVESLALLILEK